MSTFTLEHSPPPYGYKAITRQPNQLFLDIDTPCDQGLSKELYCRVKMIATRYGLSDWTQTISKSGNIHLVMNFRPPIVFSDKEAILLQMFLGSDPVKEWLSFERCIEKIKNPILLYEKE